MKYSTNLSITIIEYIFLNKMYSVILVFSEKSNLAISECKYKHMSKFRLIINQVKHLESNT